MVFEQRLDFRVIIVEERSVPPKSRRQTFVRLESVDPPWTLKD